MLMPRIHVMGASGAGTTTLGASLARALGVTHADSDTYYWLPTNPPFQTPRPVADRIALAAETLRPDTDWVLSGSALKWGERFEPLYHLLVFVRLDPAIRMARIRARERERYGARLEPGGDMEKASQAFLAWAEAYDTAGVEQRSLKAHELWLARQPTLVLRVNSEEPVEAMTQQVLTILDECA
jgi:adenylate kinase family enzyme